MNAKNWRQTLIAPDASIRAAMARIGEGRLHILLVVDIAGKLLGTVTDGDLRRAILQNVALDDSIGKIMQPRPLVASTDAGPRQLQMLMRQHDVQQIPTIDSSGRVAGLVRIEELVPASPDPQPNWVVLMAGGRGQRLRPLTDTLPKPMLSIGGKPILETIIHQFTEQGFSQVYVTVNYLAEKIRAHFGDGTEFGTSVHYLEETEPLGTAGSLSLLPDSPRDPLIVMNADILARVDFADLLAFHRRSGASVTVGVRDVTVPIPYGVVSVANDRVSSIVEKPDHKIQISAGIYVLNPEILSRVPRNSPLDMPDLVSTLIDRQEAVGAYPIADYWFDIGRVDDLSRAVAEFSGAAH